MSVEEFKRAAGYYAADLVSDGQVIGLGSGTTARYATLRIAERLRKGTLRGIIGVPTSAKTAELAQREGIPLTSLEEQEELALTIDGADEVDPQLNIIKGLGGFLLREKIVAQCTCREIIVVDDSKLVDRLGTRGPVPVEVIRFGWRQTEAALARTGAVTRQRVTDGVPFVTDEGNYIIDCRYESIPHPDELEIALSAIPGVVEHGLFLGLVHTVIVGSRAGVRIMEG